MSSQLTSKCQFLVKNLKLNQKYILAFKRTAKAIAQKNSAQFVRVEIYYGAIQERPGDSK